MLNNHSELLDLFNKKIIFDFLKSGLILGALIVWFFIQAACRAVAYLPSIPAFQR